jgi:hypothetical protein
MGSVSHVKGTPTEQRGETAGEILLKKIQYWGEDCNAKINIIIVLIEENQLFQDQFQLQLGFIQRHIF